MIEICDFILLDPKLYDKVTIVLRNIFLKATRSIHNVDDIINIKLGKIKYFRRLSYFILILKIARNEHSWKIIL